MFEYKGHIHIHSRYSDGGGKVKQIAARAAQAGLDFIIITDHCNLDGLYKGEEGYQSGGTGNDRHGSEPGVQSLPGSGGKRSNR